MENDGVWYYYFSIFSWNSGSWQVSGFHSGNVQYSPAFKSLGLDHRRFGVWTIGVLASPTGLASNLQRAQPGPFSPGCSEALSGPLWLSRSGSPQLQTVDPDRDT